MRRMNMPKRRLALALALGTLVSLTPAMASDPYFNAGVRCYQNKEFKKALGYFGQAFRNNPYDSDCIYYQALTYQQMGDSKAATKLYATLVANYSYANAGKLAAAALSRLDPEYYRQLTKNGSAPGSAVPSARVSMPSSLIAASAPIRSSGGGAGSGVSADFNSLPSEARIPFYKENNMIIIDASINNRATKMLFDTGAEACVIGKNQLRDLSIAEPKGAASGQAMGVGSTGTVDTWNMPVSLKIGPIERKGFEMSVQGTMDHYPLLGQSFFRDFQYTIDKGSGEHGTIHFVKKSGGGTSHVAAGDRYAVPFQRAGRNLIVSVEVNGRPMMMFFDTGASVCTFTTKQLKDANITVPEDATPETHSGIAGESQAFAFPVQRMKMGPIEKSNFTISATGSANMPYPLLGQTFFGDWQYTIDNAASVIRFVRR